MSLSSRRWHGFLACGLVGLAAGGCATAQPECTTDLSREGFVQELVFPQGTSRTSWFKDIPESYHVDKLDLLEGVRVRRETKSPEIAGALVLGPCGFLWTYDAVLFVATGRDVAVHMVGMPHARITWKGVGSLSHAEFAGLAERLSSLPGLQSGLPAAGATPKARERLDWDYGFAAVLWTPNQVLVHSRWDCHEESLEKDALVELVEDLADRLQTTYTTRLPEGEELEHCSF